MASTPSKGLRVLIFEDNLMWGPRLAKTATALGHEAVVFSKIPTDFPPGDVAIINLGSQAIPPDEVIRALKAGGVPIIAHAGHKEKELLELGRDLGCERLATNSEITNKLGAILAEFGT